MRADGFGWHGTGCGLTLPDEVAKDGDDIRAPEPVQKNQEPLSDTKQNCPHPFLARCTSCQSPEQQDRRSDVRPFNKSGEFQPQEGYRHAVLDCRRIRLPGMHCLLSRRLIFYVAMLFSQLPSIDFMPECGVVHPTDSVGDWFDITLRRFVLGNYPAEGVYCLIHV